MWMAMLPMIPVIGDGQQVLQPVHISDVVATVLRSLASPEVRQTIDIVGTETITFAEWLQTIRQAQGLPRSRLFHIPFLLAMALAYVAVSYTHLSCRKAWPCPWSSLSMPAICFGVPAASMPFATHAPISVPKCCCLEESSPLQSEYRF